MIERRKVLLESFEGDRRQRQELVKAQYMTDLSMGTYQETKEHGKKA